MSEHNGAIAILNRYPVSAFIDHYREMIATIGADD
jgi:hypothetical protein